MTFFSNKVFAVSATGEATAYKITMTYLELCEIGSTTANCLNPLAVGSGVFICGISCICSRKGKD